MSDLQLKFVCLKKLLNSLRTYSPQGGAVKD